MYSRCFGIVVSLFLSIVSLTAFEGTKLPPDIQKVMSQSKYKHSTWGVYLKDLKTGTVYFDLNANKLFSPASTTKLFSVSALLHAFGDDYRFKTPVFATGSVTSGVLWGDIILVAKGDLTLGGRFVDPDKIAFTKMDHIVANEVPGVILTNQDPLYGLNILAQQISKNGIRQITGDVLIDDTLFETTQKRGLTISPIIINENLIDIMISPSQIGREARLNWRPKVQGYEIDNQVKTIARGQPLAIDMDSDKTGRKIIVKGTIPEDQSEIVRTFAIRNPKDFARAAFIQALKQQGIQLTASIDSEKLSPSKPLSAYPNLKLVALWTSAPLSEYAKLILKVSHNLGADLIPLLLASKQKEKTFDEGMRLIGDFVMQEVKLSSDAFVFVDAAGGNENRLSPQGEVQLLEYMYNKTDPLYFQNFYNALPILGVDGSLEDFARNTTAVGLVRAKPGTGVAFNVSTGQYFLTTQALSGYMEGKNGHLFAYMVVVNNATMPTINDIFSIFEDESQISSMLRNYSE